MIPITLTTGHTIRGAEGRNSTRPRWLPLAAAFLLAAAALPRLIAGFVVLPYEGLALARVSERAPAWVERASGAYATAATVYAGGVIGTRLAELRYAAAARYPAGPARSSRLEAAATAQRRALADRPVDPHGWTRLAGSQTGRGRLFARALASAITTGPWAPDLLAARARLGTLAGEPLDGDLRRAVRAQLAAAARHTPQRLAAVVNAPALRRLMLADLADDAFARCRAAAAFAGRLRGATCAPRP